MVNMYFGNEVRNGRRICPIGFIVGMNGKCVRTSNCGYEMAAVQND